MMKKIIILILFAVLAFPINAQFEKHEISGSYGLVTVDQIGDIIAEVLVSIFTLGNFETADQNYTGAMYLTYNYAASYRWDIGVVAGIDMSNGNLMWDDELEGTFMKNHTTLAVETNFRWVKKSFVELYTGIGVGYTFTKNTAEMLNGDSESINSGHVTGQLNALGIRVGKKFGVHTELGFGYQGILNFGFSYKF